MIFIAVFSNYLNSLPLPPSNFTDLHSYFFAIMALSGGNCFVTPFYLIVLELLPQ